MAVGLHVAVAQVTGASSGIGEATARDLAVRGAAVDVTEPDATRWSGPCGMSPTPSATRLPGRRMSR
jgi:hypothetical protein